jgi:uncharacterized protein
MRLHLDRDRDEPLLWEETVVLDPTTLGQDLLVELGPIAVHGRVDKIDEDGGEGRGGSKSRSKAAANGPASFQIAMDLHYTQGLACTRCLQPVRSEISTHADLAAETRPTPARRAPPKAEREGQSRPRKPREKEKQPEPEVELEKDELGVLVIAGEHLDTEPLIAEQILLEVPMKPLCAPDCRGLCPRCGADRNATPDCCEEPGADERWEPLAGLRDRLSADRR